MRLVGWALIACMVACGCEGNDTAMEYSRLITVENSVVFDSVHTTLKIRNRSSEPIKLDIIPECDCTRAIPEQLTVKPHGRKKVKISFHINSSGAYERILYLQREDMEEPDTVVIKGYAEK